MLVPVLDRRIERGCAVDAARDDDRSLEREIDLGFEDAERAAHALPGRGEVGVGGDAHLALAVIPELRALEDAGTADLLDGGRKRRRVRHREIARHGHADRG